MNLALKYKAQVFYKPIESNGESNDDFEVTLRIPKVEMILKRKTSHEINMIFNQILIFSAGLKSMLTSPSPLEWQEMKKALDKIEVDLDGFSQEVGWVKAIYEAIQSTPFKGDCRK